MSRLWAIGDIHGFSLAFSRILDAIQPEPDDVIVTLGDYIDRGPDSRGVLDRVIRLQTECQLKTLRGNHEQMLLDLWAREKNGTLYKPIWKSFFSKKHELQLKDWLDLGGRQTLSSYGPLTTKISQIPHDHLDFMASTELFFETPGFLFMHAAYVPQLEMADQPQEVLLYHRLRVSVPEPHISGKKVYVGHSAQRTGEILDCGHLVCIDTCLYGGGWLTAVEVQTGETLQVDAGGRFRRLS
ncbi:MAG: serine/threonine protein phosphatase [Thermoguttaceae bacterium]|nr:serine/threonine protein phosphatase [Thermoguttaceae bacterium]